MILLDLTDLQDSWQNASISVDPLTVRIMGKGKLLSSFGVESYMAYLCVDFKAAGVKVWVNELAGTERKDCSSSADSLCSKSMQVGWCGSKPNNDTFQACGGMSFVSTAQVCVSAKQEIQYWGFDRDRNAAEPVSELRFNSVSTVPVEASRGFQQTFFTSLGSTR